MRTSLLAVAMATILCVASLFAGDSAPVILARIPANLLLAALLLPVAGGILMFALAGWQGENSRTNNMTMQDRDG
ncbi:MAG: hypothetical protein R3D32_07325 [Nitratireductor sp.]